MGRITRLFQLRNKLAHPTTQRHRVKSGRFVGPDHPAYKDFNPEQAASFLLAVAQAAVSLAKTDRKLEGTGALPTELLKLEKPLRETSRKMRDELPRPLTALAHAAAVAVVVRSHRTRRV